MMLKQIKYYIQLFLSKMEVRWKNFVEDIKDEYQEVYPIFLVGFLICFYFIVMLVAVTWDFKLIYGCSPGLGDLHIIIRLIFLYLYRVHLILIPVEDYPFILLFSLFDL